ncbi:MAG: diguanylate cyclase [Sulfuricurvum sp.]|nr:diguanylate cyclase [Sulfuricurvum sp.]
MASEITDKDLVKLNIKPKLAVLATISLLGMVVILLILLKSITESLYHERQLQTQQLIDMGTGIIRHFHALQVNGELSEKSAQHMAMTTLQSAIYGGTGYFWINDIEGILLMHPYNPELVGKSVLDMRDIDGKYFFKDFIATAKAGGGWVDYYWSKPSEEKTYRKLSHVTLFKPWNWVLGTGIYLDDMEAEIQNIVYRAIAIVAVLFIILILVSILMSNHFLKQLSNLATHDPLTSLLTRRFLCEKMPILISNHDRSIQAYLAVIFLDIDHFKNVNDTYGHAYGDKVLSQVGKAILKSVRTGDIGVRYGGEEFVIAMSCNDKDEAIQVAERIRAEAHAIEFQKGRKKFSVTLSAGIAYRQENEPFENLIKRADEKLYKAKEEGRDRIEY